MEFMEFDVVWYLNDLAPCDSFTWPRVIHSRGPVWVNHVASCDSFKWPRVINSRVPVWFIFTWPRVIQLRGPVWFIHVASFALLNRSEWLCIDFSIKWSCCLLVYAPPCYVSLYVCLAVCVFVSLSLSVLLRWRRGSQCGQSVLISK